jgi:transposase
VEVISRDRWAAYAQAATEGAPQAKPVADRWHLLKNLREAIERLFERRHDVVKDCLQGVMPAAAAPPPSQDSPPLSAPVSSEAVPPTPRQQALQDKRQRRVER